MWIVRIALKRPYTFIVFALVIVLMTPFVLMRMPTDILPEIDIPVISILWNYNGFSPDQMENYIVSNFERFLTTVVDDIDHIESQTIEGRSVIKVFFQPGADVRLAMAETSSGAQRAASPVASRHRSPADPHVFRVDGSHSAVGNEGERAFRTGVVRFRREHRAQPDGDRAGRGDPVALRRKTARSGRERGYSGAAGKRPVAGGCDQRDQRAEPAASGRDR